jgi:hypothetical protein
LERPDVTLLPELKMMLVHFFALSRHRLPAFSEIPASIPLTQIEAYYRIYAVAEYMALEEFCDWMIELDKVLIDYYTKLSDTRKKSKDIKH